MSNQGVEKRLQQVPAGFPWVPGRAETATFCLYLSLSLSVRLAAYILNSRCHRLSTTHTYVGRDPPTKIREALPLVTLHRSIDHLTRGWEVDGLVVSFSLSFPFSILFPSFLLWS